MKKFLWIFVAILCVPIVGITGCGQAQVAFNEYNIVASYDEEQKTLSCEQTINYVNNSSNSLNSVCFYLYPNAFDTEQKPVSTAYLNKAYPNGTSYGNITFISVKIGVVDAVYEISTPNANILTVNLEKELYPTERVEIFMEYVVSLANINHRLGYGDNTVNFGNFFPIACVYEQGEGFVKNEFSSNGDPFYSETANFDVEVTFPSTYNMASTGDMIVSTEGSLKTATCKANKVRDFCFVLSRNFEVLSQNVDGVNVNYFYYDDEMAQSHLRTAVDALKTFQEFFGKYPYKQLSVVKTNFCYGGMEYPNLVMISDAIDDHQTFDYVIVHEIAHQWWYSLVGNNQFSQAWQDESLTEYSTFLFYEKNEEYGFDYDIMIENTKDTYINFVKIYSSIYGEVEQSMNRTLSDYHTEPEYVNCVYTKGVLMYDSLRCFIGKNKFFKCAKDYFEKYSYKNTSPEQLIETFSKSAHIDLESFFASWLNGEVVIGK